MSQKRSIISLERKIQILDKLKTVKSPTLVGIEFGIKESTVRSIAKAEGKIRETVNAGGSVNLIYATKKENEHEKEIKKLDQECVKAWVAKLKRLTPLQKSLATEAINNILIQAEQGTLNENSVKINEGTEKDPLSEE